VGEIRPQRRLVRAALARRYGAFSVSSSGIEKVIQYIDEQKQRHRKFTFEQEYLTLLKKQGIPFDPKNIFG
jgi:putative transposase